MREFKTGASRNSDNGKYDIDGFVNPLVLNTQYAYMHKHRFLENGNVRDGDNWQKGIPVEEYVKSLLRHTHDVHLWHRGYHTRDGIVEALCGVIFNAMGIIHEIHEGRYDGELIQDDLNLLNGVSE